MEQLDITLSIDFLECTKSFLGPDARDRVFEQHQLFLLDSQGADRLHKFYDYVKEGKDYPVLKDSIKMASKMCAELQNSAFSIIFHPVQEELDNIMKLEVWDSSSAGSGSTQQEMPEFSFSPQEYITQIGQYLMTLPQHLEPYMTNDNPALSRAFQERVFPYCSGLLETEGQNPADFILSCVAKASCETYQAVILRIPTLTVNSTRQLTTDISKSYSCLTTLIKTFGSPKLKECCKQNFILFEVIFWLITAFMLNLFFKTDYLGDILEDLGHPLSDNLQSVLMLLKLPAKDFWVQSTGCPQKLVTTIRQMRNLTMT